MVRQLSSIMLGSEKTTSTLINMRKRHETQIFILLLVVQFGLIPLLVLWETKTGIGMVLGIVGALALLLAIVRWPIVGLYAIAASVFLVEQEGLATPIFTDHLYVFYWPPQLEGFVE